MKNLFVSCATGTLFAFKLSIHDFCFGIQLTVLFTIKLGGFWRPFNVYNQYKTNLKSFIDLKPKYCTVFYYKQFAESVLYIF